MIRYLVGYLAAAAAMAVLDSVWLRLAVKAVYEPAAGSLFSEHTNMTAAVLFYVLYILGIMVFATGPALRGGGWPTALMLGAALGFFAYMTYDLTNMATLKLWPAHLAAIDIAWGTLLTAAAATAGYAAAARFA
ncbi:MAG: DUF2177 family protein [Rhizomicrobium sp.]